MEKKFGSIEELKAAITEAIAVNQEEEDKLYKELDKLHKEARSIQDQINKIYKQTGEFDHTREVAVRELMRAKDIFWTLKPKSIYQSWERKRFTVDAERNYGSDIFEFIDKYAVVTGGNKEVEEITKIALNIDEKVGKHCVILYANTNPDELKGNKSAWTPDPSPVLVAGKIASWKNTCAFTEEVTEKTLVPFVTEKIKGNLPSADFRIANSKYEFDGWKNRPYIFDVKICKTNAEYKRYFHAMKVFVRCNNVIDVGNLKPEYAKEFYNGVPDIAILERIAYEVEALKPKDD